MNGIKVNGIHLPKTGVKDLKRRSLTIACTQEFSLLSECYSSVNLLQEIIKQHKFFDHLVINPHFCYAAGSILHEIMKNPRVLVYSCNRDNSIQDRLLFLPVGKYEEVHPGDYLNIKPGDDHETIYRPFSIVYFIRTTQMHDGCDLNLQSRLLLSSLKKTENINNTIFVIQRTRHTTQYNSQSLLIISMKIQELLNLKNNTIYHRIFLEDDCELRIRLGFMMQACILNGLQKLHLEMSTRALRKRNKMQKEIMESFVKLLEHQLSNKMDNSALDQVKVLSQRNKLIKAYGYIQGGIRVYVNGASNEVNVRKYFEKFFNLTEHPIAFHIWPMNTTITQFAIEQGSRIDILDPSSSTIGAKYGTLGMFLQNNRTKDLYFTTCAHVVGEGLQAFCSDHSVLGTSIFACEKPSGNSKQWMDLSVVRVANNKKSHCLCGLKDQTSEIFEYTIYSGVLSDIRSASVYKWGAITGLTEGKICGYLVDTDDLNEKKFLQLKINSPTPFAMPADSGSLICFTKSDDVPNGPCAAFVIVGQMLIENEELYLCYEVSLALDEIKNSCLRGQEITPFAVIGKSNVLSTPGQRHVTSSSIVTRSRSRSHSPPVSSKFKKQKMLPPRK